MAKILSYVNLHNAPSLGELTSSRSMATLSLLGRYAFIDIPLSNFSNSNFDTIGILAKDNMLNLIKHIDNAMTYSNNTKTGKTILCYNEDKANTPLNTDINNIARNDWLLKEKDYQYVIIAPCHIIYTLDFSKLLKKHIKSGASISVLYKKDLYSDKYSQRKILSLDSNERVKSITNIVDSGEELNISLETYIINIDKVFTALEHIASMETNTSLEDLIASSCNTQRIYGCSFEGEVAVVDSIEDYYKITKSLLNNQYLHKFMAEGWPISTRTHDTPPSMYLENAMVTNSYISNGVIIDGKVDSSVICRNTVIKKGATVEGSIILTGAEISNDCHIKNAIIDKGCKILYAPNLEGKENEPVLIKENQYYCDLKVLMIASECNPLIKVGGLADVVFSLSDEFAKINSDVSVILPYYKVLDEYEFNSSLKSEFQFSVRVNNKDIYTEVFLYKYKNIKYYLIQDNEYFYTRDNIYGYEDDGERFAYFQLAALQFISLMNLKYDIIHLHDWETGMIPLLYKQYYYKYDQKNPKFVYTIHNNKFIGNIDPNKLKDYFGLDISFFNNGTCRYNDKVSYLKTGVITCDSITSVSKTYVKELLDGSDGVGFKDIYTSRQNDFTGIINGIDYNEWTPIYDKIIDHNYSYETFARIKKLNKYQLLKEYNFKNPKLPLVILISRLSSQKGIDIVLESIDKIKEKKINLFILGTGEKSIEEQLLKAEEKYKENFHVEIRHSNKLAHKLFAAADFFIIPSRYEPCGLTQMISHRYGTLPIARATGGLVDSIISYNGNNELIANGYLFNDFSASALKKSVSTAINLYLDNKDIHNKLVENAMKVDHSWRKSSFEYLDLYIKTINK